MVLKSKHPSDVDVKWECMREYLCEINTAMDNALLKEIDNTHAMFKSYVVFHSKKDSNGITVPRPYVVDGDTLILAIRSPGSTKGGIYMTPKGEITKIIFDTEQISVSTRYDIEKLKEIETQFIGHFITIHESTPKQKWMSELRVGDELEDPVAEMKNKINKLILQQKQYQSAYDSYQKISNEIEGLQTKLQKECPHHDAYCAITTNDSYEGRTYANYHCPTCGKSWEDRVICGELAYPRINQKENNENGD